MPGLPTSILLQWSVQVCFHALKFRSSPAAVEVSVKILTAKGFRWGRTPSQSDHQLGPCLLLHCMLSHERVVTIVAEPTIGVGWVFVHKAMLPRFLDTSLGLFGLRQRRQTSWTTLGTAKSL